MSNVTVGKFTTHYLRYGPDTTPTEDLYEVEVDKFGVILVSRDGMYEHRIHPDDIDIFIDVLSAARDMSPAVAAAHRAAAEATALAEQAKQAVLEKIARGGA